MPRITPKPSFSGFDFLDFCWTYFFTDSSHPWHYVMGRLILFSGPSLLPWDIPAFTSRKTIFSPAKSKEFLY
jgi:hypothetical protein